MAVSTDPLQEDRTGLSQAPIVVFLQQFAPRWCRLRRRPLRFQFPFFLLVLFRGLFRVEKEIRSLDRAREVDQPRRRSCRRFPLKTGLRGGGYRSVFPDQSPPRRLTSNASFKESDRSHRGASSSSSSIFTRRGDTGVGVRGVRGIDASSSRRAANITCAGRVNVAVVVVVWMSASSPPELAEAPRASLR